MTARFVVYSNDRLSQPLARLAVLLAYGPADDADIDVVVNAPVPDGHVHVFDRQQIRENVGA